MLVAHLQRRQNKRTMHLAVRLASSICAAALLAAAPAWPQSYGPVDMRIDMRAPEARTDPLPDRNRDYYSYGYGWNSDCYRYNSAGFCARAATPFYDYPWAGNYCPPGVRGVTRIFRGRSYYCP